ncbi:MAG: alpha/beta hydrolase [Candidatus Glassbacteria bacterium]|nr:alpha/beta hydrolase [Candidatus Glassbacteria bacterium]
MPVKRCAFAIIFALAVVLSAEPLPAQESLPGKTVSVNGMEMYYETYGQGEPLVLLHGFTGSSRGWRRLIDDFSGQYSLILPDLRGHGRSTNPSGKFTHRQSALDVYALLDHLGIGKFKGIGSSTGGMTLVHMATSQVERVEAMILIGATIYFPEQAREIMRSTFADSITDERRENLLRTHKRGDGQVRELLEQFRAFKDSYDDMNFTPPFLSTIKARTLIVHGDRDRFFPVNIPLEIYGSIPESYLWIVPNGGHGPLGGRWSGMFVQIAHEFLGGEWERR